MKKALFALITFLAFSLLSCSNESNSKIRINQLGYRPGDLKTAVFISTARVKLKSFRLIDAATGKEVVTINKVRQAPALDQFTSCYRLDFSGFNMTGTYRISAGRAISPDFRISDDVYKGSADFLLNYMRQQRCGYNPWLKDSCHTSDGYIIYGNKNDSAHIDVTGGWHDAADYLQYVATSANAVYQMLFAWSENPGSFNDNFSASGLPGQDGIADVLNESKWGLEWLIKMNPAPGVMFNQIADDRDHIGFRFPNTDTANYGKGRERPVYLCTGQPQGVFRYKNRATGISSTAGKYASAFARASMVFLKTDPEWSAMLEKKAIEAFTYGLENPGACQTAPGRAPYFYEEDNWTDDMELAAIELFNLTGKKEYFERAIGFGRNEEVTPWMGADTARHYQWYPFVNMGHPWIARSEKNDSDEFAGYMKKGLEKIMSKAAGNPFMVGVPFIWCSNNLVAATLTQCHLYASITGDNQFAEMETAHRDWLFGCNPWGTSMIVGLPEDGDYPENSHSSYVIRGEQVNGGLVDGPVYESIFKSHSKYIGLRNADQYAPFQTSLAYYHDDTGDYTSNECTMDGTACLVYYLSSMENHSDSPIRRNMVISRGAITRMDTTENEIWPCFTAHDLNDGFPHIISELKKHNIKASFFLTGDFLRDPVNSGIIEQLIGDGHYIGAHSDKHLLYCDWTNRDSMLVTRNEFRSDLLENYKELGKKGITRGKATLFLPPYEWYNDSIAAWTRELGLTLVNISQGMKISQDWTYPRPEGKYYSSDELMKDLKSYEMKKGMNGYIMLIHPGTDQRRTDKFYMRIDSVFEYLEKKGYKFRSFSEL